MKKIIFIGLLSFIVAAIWQLPLSFAKPYAEKFVQTLKLEGTTGTIWNGSAQHVIHNNQDFGHVSWKVKPLQSLTSLSLKTAFKVQGNLVNADGIAAVKPDKTIILNDTHFSMDAKTINNFQKQAKLSGDIKGTIKSAELVQGKLPVLDGVVDWTQGAVSSLLLKLGAGDYHAVITPSNDGLHIVPTSTNAPLQLNGSIDLSKDWIYQPKLDISSKDPSISGLLKFAGKPQPDGATRMDKSLDLKPYLHIK